MVSPEKVPSRTLEVAPRIAVAAQQAAQLYPEMGTKGVSALAYLGEVDVSRSSLWVNQRQPVSIKRAMLIEINSGHRIRAEDLLPKSDALALLRIRLAAPPTEQNIRAWIALLPDQKSKSTWLGKLSRRERANSANGNSEPGNEPRRIVRAVLSGFIRKRISVRKKRPIRAK